MKSSKILSAATIVSLTGGLGNQLFQLTAGLFAAKNNPLVLDLGLGLPRRDIYGLPEILHFKFPPNTNYIDGQKRQKFVMKVINFVLIWGAQEKNNPRNPISIIIQILSSIVISLHFLSLKIVRSAHGLGFHHYQFDKKKAFLVGYFQSYYWASQEPTYSVLKNLQLKCEHPLIPKYKQLALEEKPLIVHVRLGDYREIQSFGIPSKDYYLESISELWNSGKYGSIWVFTNEQDEALNYLPEWVVRRCRWIPEIGGSAAQTLEVMRFGHAYVIANSTYSWWGAFLSYTKNPEVIAPYPWFKMMMDPDRLIPTNWQRKDAWKE